MAAAAIRSGHRVIAIEAFGDLDHPAGTGVTALPRDHGVPFSASAAALFASQLEAPAAAYGAAFENDLSAVARLAEGRQFWGNPAAVLVQVRNPLLLSRTLLEAGLPTPTVRSSAPPDSRIQWLIKPRRSGGGQRIRSWNGRGSVPRSAYLQQRIAGLPGSLLFVANGRRIVPFGLTRQLIGDRRFGAAAYRYVGNLLSSSRAPLFPKEAELLRRIGEAAQLLTESFGLVGVNGIDFMARGGIPYPIEVNPRWTGAMELAERAYDLPLFDWHREGCGGQLPVFDLGDARRRGPTRGKAIVFARGPIVLPDTRQWLGSPWIADLPQPGERIGAGHPICTVFGSGADSAAAMGELLAGQARLLARSRPRAGRAA
jgi:predicted ATP-grasp superfamily ATP-dependent carboligase